MAEFKSKSLDILKTIGIKAAFVILTIIIGIVLIKLILNITRKILKKAHVDNAVINFAASLIKSLLWIIDGFIVGVIIGIPITALIAIVSASTVAIGLALQGSLSNLASGIIIAVTKPFIEGDFVDTGVVSGKVINIKLFTTELVTIDNKKIVIPNSTIATSNITNFTNQSRRMINITVPVSYTSDIDKVTEILTEIALANPLALKDIPPIIKLHEYASSSLNFIFRVWTKTEDYWELYWWVNSEIINKFRLNNIEVPYSKLDVFIKEPLMINNKAND